MASLLDVAGTAAPRQVEIRGVLVDVPGVSVAGLAILMRRFAAVRDMLSGREVALTLDTLFDLGPEVVAAVLAAGTGKPGDADTEALAAALTLDEQLELGQAVFEATFPKGPASFFGRLQAMAAVATKVAGRP